MASPTTWSLCAVTTTENFECILFPVRLTLPLQFTAALALCASDWLILTIGCVIVTSLHTIRGFSLIGGIYVFTTRKYRLFSSCTSTVVSGRTGVRCVHLSPEKKWVNISSLCCVVHIQVCNIFTRSQMRHVVVF